MFTLKNTERATHVRWSTVTSAFVFFDHSNGNDRISYFMPEKGNPKGNWSKVDHPIEKDCIELSRPQPDIDALFSGAPDWATEYAWLLIGLDRVYYWLNDDGFMCLDKSCITKFRKYGSNHATKATKATFTIIATSPSKETVVDPCVDVPVYTQEMIDNSHLPLVGMRCQVRVVDNDKSVDDWFEGVTCGHYQGLWVVKIDDLKDGTEGYFDGFSLGYIKPIDQRTDKEIACGKILKELYDSGEEYDLHVAMDLAYDRWVGK